MDGSTNNCPNRRWRIRILSERARAVICDYESPGPGPAPTPHHIWTGEDFPHLGEATLGNSRRVEWRRQCTNTVKPPCDEAVIMATSPVHQTSRCGSGGSHRPQSWGPAWPSSTGRWSIVALPGARIGSGSHRIGSSMDRRKLRASIGRLAVTGRFALRDLHTAAGRFLQ